MIEIATADDQAWILALWDLTKFYDTVAIESLCIVAEDAKYPIEALRIASSGPPGPESSEGGQVLQ